MGPQTTVYHFLVSTAMSESNCKNYTAMIGLFLVMMVGQFGTKLSGEKNLTAQIIAGFGGDAKGKASYDVVEFLILAMSVVFLIVAITKPADSKGLWTAIAGYTILIYGCCLPFQFCFGTDAMGEIIVNTIWWISIGSWHIIIGHDCCSGGGQMGYPQQVGMQMQWQ